MLPNDASQVNNTTLYKQRPPARDGSYLKFIRLLPCVGCGKRYGIEAAHVGPHGLGQKASDYDTVPLCKGAAGCHKKLHRMGRVDFETVYKLDLAELIQMFQSFYQRKLGGKVVSIREGR